MWNSEKVGFVKILEKKNLGNNKTSYKLLKTQAKTSQHFVFWWLM